MKTIIVIESAQELIRFAAKDRMASDKSPIIPTKTKLIFENNFNDVRIESVGFELSDQITVESLITALIKHIGLECHIT